MAFYVVVLLVALTGQVTGATQKLGTPALVAIPAVGALELGGVVVMANADVRRRLGERAIASRILSAAIAAGAVTFNWLAHDNHLLGGFFAGMSALGYLVWLMHTENVRRDRLRAISALAATTPAYELIGHWLRHPLVTRRARSMAKADPRLGLYGSLDLAHAQLRRQQRDAAISKVLRRKIRAAVDPATATIAVHVYDLDEIAARLADTADYDGLTALIAADLTPTRIAAGAGRQQRRLGRRRASAGRPSTPTEHLTAHEDTLHDRTADTTVAEPSQPADVRDDEPGTADQPAVERPEGPAAELLRPAAPRRVQRPEGRAPTATALPEVPRLDSTGDDTIGEAPGPGDPEEQQEIPDGTAAAVAYLLGVDPQMGYDEIAKRIGRTERTVRRNLPSGFRRPRRARPKSAQWS
ncbi:hypothetical protein [Micromonospora sp. DT233]|uniref:hypothetical protein n=1 Tax=Micromonospora sp. DT233 TaxID=3393432 RepID=UPI003CEC3BF9